jgi:hypothetical protein
MMFCDNPAHVKLVPLSTPHRIDALGDVKYELRCTKYVGTYLTHKVRLKQVHEMLKPETVTVLKVCANNNKPSHHKRVEMPTALSSKV